MDLNINNTIASKAGVGVDAGLRQYMNRVYSLMALGVALTSIVSYVIASIPQLLIPFAMGPMKWVALFGVLGIGFVAPNIIMRKSRTMAATVFWLYAFLWGLMLAPMIAYFLKTQQGAYDIARAFLITSIMFAGVSLYGYVTKRDLSVWGRFILMGSIGLLVLLIMNIFIQSSAFGLAISLAVISFSAGVTAYQTQMIRNVYYQISSGQVVSRFAILGAFMLYGSFVTIFVYVLNIIGIMRQE